MKKGKTGRKEGKTGGRKERQEEQEEGRNSYVYRSCTDKKGAGVGCVSVVGEEGDNKGTGLRRQRREGKGKRGGGGKEDYAK